MKTFVTLWTIVFLAFIAVMCTVDISNYIPSVYTVFSKNRPLVTGALSILLISVFIWLMVSLYLLKKYSVKVEKLSLGGVNILFNESATLYKKSVKNHLDSKRAIFKLRKNVDAFDEVISSYYQTYQFIRDEMKILNPKKDREIYYFSNEMLMVLNRFLTNYQNNYKRWYKYISDKDEVVDRVSGDVMRFHATSINKIQMQYYDYERILKGFKD
ncbi:hypothetical protein JK323_26470, partial [Klebsiella michiganensis]|uniref:hypothetical protein n=1 Tax=Klebsiella michiganensis TaxID=1134687 RepID=UPI00191F2FEA